MPRLGNVSKVSLDQHRLEWSSMLDDKRKEPLLFVELLPLGVAAVLDMQCLLHFQDMTFDEISDLILQSTQKHHSYVAGYRLVGVWWFLFLMMLMWLIPKSHHRLESVALWTCSL